MRPDLKRSIRSFFDPRGDDIAHRLRELPGETDTPYDWTEFRRRERARYWRPSHAVKWQHAATAAGVTVFIAVMAMWGRSAHHTAELNASVAPPTQVHPVPDDPTRDSPSHDERGMSGQASASESAAAEAALLAALRAARERAQASQQWLARQPDEPAVIRVGPRLAVTNLEDRIAWLDDALTDEQFGRDAQQVDALRQERARLVNSLAQVRYAETLAVVN